MANQVLLQETLIPLLGEYGMAAVPVGKLASHCDFLRVLYHHIHYKSIGFQGIRSIVCRIDSNKKARCGESKEGTEAWCDVRAGCLQLGSPCLLAKIKKNWNDAHLPLKDNDEHLLRALEKIKKGVDKKKRHGLSREDTEALKRSTVNLAPEDWEQKILADRFLSAPQRRAKISLMRDYLCPDGSRYGLLLCMM